MTHLSWQQTLDTFAERLEEQRAALLCGAPDTVAPFEPPSGLGAIPEDVRARAEALLRDALELEAAIAVKVSAFTRESRVVRRFSPRTVAAPAPSYIDDSL